MADIKRYPLLRHLRADTTAFVQHQSNGRVKHSGAGLSFWLRPTTAALSEVPLDDREQALLFHARTADFQDITVQATVNYRVTDPSLALSRIDFSISPETGLWNATPLEALASLLTELAQQPALELLATMTMTEAVASGVKPVRDQVAAALASDSRLAERGLDVTDFRVVAIRTDAEMERALQTATREAIQQEADRATFERRALAVERERAISENEMQNRIELARREADLVEQEGQNERRRATEKAAAERIAAEAAAENTRLLGQAAADAEAARLAAHQGVEGSVLLAVALRELAVNLPSISHLTLTQDLIAPVLARLAEPAQAAGGGPFEGGV